MPPKADKKRREDSKLKIIKPICEAPRRKKGGETSKLPFSFERKREGAPQPKIPCIQAKLLTENERKQRVINYNDKCRTTKAEERSLTSVDSRMRQSAVGTEAAASPETQEEGGGRKITGGGSGPPEHI